MLEGKRSYCATGRRVPRDPSPSRSRKTVASLRTQPFVCWIPAASTDRPNQTDQFRECQRIRLPSERLCHNRCVAFAPSALSFHIDEFLPLRNKRCSDSSGPHFRTPSSKPVF